MNAPQTGIRFGRLLVGERSPGRKNHWMCRCDCGASKEIYSGSLKRGATRSCGCLQRETSSQRGHGLVNTGTYRSWASMLQRCRGSLKSSAKNYCDRGILVCERWNDFLAFYADMGDRPAGTSIDRIDVNGNYEPSNCRWATDTQQARNRRNNKLTEELVSSLKAEIVASGSSGVELARKYGVSDGLVSHIKHGIAWADVEADFQHSCVNTTPQQYEAAMIAIAKACGV